MARKKSIGKAGMIPVVLAAGIMSAITYLFGPAVHLSGELGICLPSPNLWPIDPLISWIANAACTLILVVGAYVLNRHCNFIKATEPVLPAIFLILVASNPWINDYLCTSTLICGINLIAMAILFACYRRDNATQAMFVIGTLFSVGAMVEYAFIPYILPYALGAIVMKTFRIKEFLAMGMGIVAPYWVGVGLGLIDVSSFRLPEITNLFNGYARAEELIFLMASVGLAAFFGFILGLNNSIKLFAGNSRVYAMNLVINFVGVASAVCIIVDFTNMLAYMTTLYFTVAVQVANLCALWTIKREWLVVFIPGLIYVGLFIGMMLT